MANLNESVKKKELLNISMRARIFGYVYGFEKYTDHLERYNDQEMFAEHASVLHDLCIHTSVSVLIITHSKYHLPMHQPQNYSHMTVL